MIRHGIRKAAALMLLLLVFMQVMIAAPILAQTEATNVRAHLSGPSVIGTERGGDYTFTLIDPDGRDWDYKIYVTAANTTGASPLEKSPINGTLTPDNNTAMFNVTGMQSPGEMDIHVNCTSGSYHYERVQPITVVVPVVLSVDITNPSNTVINNATVRFLVDGTEIDRQTVSSLGAKQSKTVSTEWISADKRPGWHDSTIIVDLDGDGVVEKDSGDMVVQDRFYVEGGGDWVLMLTVFAGVTALLLGMGYLSKKKIK